MGEGALVCSLSLCDSSLLRYIAKATPVPLVDFLEAELERALTWLRAEEPHRRLAACAVLRQLGMCWLAG